jgi:hypothetical protein
VESTDISSYITIDQDFRFTVDFSDLEALATNGLYGHIDIKITAGDLTYRSEESGG